MNAHGNDILWPEPATSGSRRSILASDLEINGDVVSRGPVDLLGKVIGSVFAPEVVVASTGDLDGKAVSGA